MIVFFTFFTFSAIWSPFVFSTFHEKYHLFSLPSTTSISIPQPYSNSYPSSSHHWVVTIPSPPSAILPIKASSRVQGVRDSREDWRFLDLSLAPQNMDKDKCTHNHWFPIALTQDVGISLVAAFEDDTCDQNDKPSIPPHLTPSTPPSPQ